MRELATSEIRLVSGGYLANPGITDDYMVQAGIYWDEGQRVNIVFTESGTMTWWDGGTQHSMEITAGVPINGYLDNDFNGWPDFFEGKSFEVN